MKTANCCQLGALGYQCKHIIKNSMEEVRKQINILHGEPAPLKVGEEVHEAVSSRAAPSIKDYLAYTRAGTTISLSELEPPSQEEVAILMALFDGQPLMQGVNIPTYAEADSTAGRKHYTPPGVEVSLPAQECVLGMDLSRGPGATSTVEIDSIQYQQAKSRIHRPKFTPPEIVFFDYPTLLKSKLDLQSGESEKLRDKVHELSVKTLKQRPLRGEMEVSLDYINISLVLTKPEAPKSSVHRKYDYTPTPTVHESVSAFGKPMRMYASALPSYANDPKNTKV